MAGTFAPPEPPHFPVEDDDQYNTVRDSFEAGYVQTRPLWQRNRRKWKLLWRNAGQGVRDYIKGFFRDQLGGANNFSWAIPATFLYSPAPQRRPGMVPFVGGALSLRTYYVASTWANASGETKTSPEFTITVGAGKLLQIKAHRFPGGVTSEKFYIGTASGSLTLAATATESEEILQEPASGWTSGAAPPSENTLAETVQVRLRPGTLRISGKASSNVWDIEMELEEVLGGGG